LQGSIASVSSWPARIAPPWLMSCVQAVPSKVTLRAPATGYEPLACHGSHGPSRLSAIHERNRHTWRVTSGGMAGVCQGDPNNVTVDGAGYLHLRISHNNGV